MVSATKYFLYFGQTSDWCACFKIWRLVAWPSNKSLNCTLKVARRSGCSFGCAFDSWRWLCFGGQIVSGMSSRSFGSFMKRWQSELCNSLVWSSWNSSEQINVSQPIMSCLWPPLSTKILYNTLICSMKLLSFWRLFLLSAQLRHDHEAGVVRNSVLLAPHEWFRGYWESWASQATSIHRMAAYIFLLHCRVNVNNCVISSSMNKL